MQKVVLNRYDSHAPKILTYWIYLLHHKSLPPEATISNSSRCVVVLIADTTPYPAELLTHKIMYLPTLSMLTWLILLDNYNVFTVL